MQEFISVYTLGLHDQVLAAGGHRGNFCEQLPEASPMSRGDSASWLQVGSTLARAKASNDRGSTSGITLLRKVECFSTRQDNERSEKSMLNNYANTMTSEEGGEGSASSIRAEIPLKPGMQAMVRQLCPGNSWRPIVKKRSTCSPRRTPPPPKPKQMDA